MLPLNTLLPGDCLALDEFPPPLSAPQAATTVRSSSKPPIAIEREPGIPYFGAQWNVFPYPKCAGALSRAISAPRHAVRATLCCVTRSSAHLVSVSCTI